VYGRDEDEAFGFLNLWVQECHSVMKFGADFVFSALFTPYAGLVPVVPQVDLLDWNPNFSSPTDNGLEHGVGVAVFSGAALDGEYHLSLVDAVGGYKIEL